MIFLAVPLMGLCVSLVSVFIGLGGGILLVPLLPLVFGLSVHEAVATSLMTIVFVVSENTQKFHKMGQVNWPVVALMGPASAVFAIIAAQLAQKVDGRVILYTLLVLLSLVALKTFIFSFISKNYQASEKLQPKQQLTLVFAGGLAGLTSGFAGVGAGVILSPAMILLRAVQPVQLVPTANANMMCTTLAAALSFLASGHFVSWYQWGLVRLDLAVGVFVSASFFSRFLRPHQGRLPFATKSLILSLLLLALVMRILNELMTS